MDSEAAFLSYRWEDDPRWQVYRLNVVIPHNESSAAYEQSLKRIQRKYYQRYVDGNFQVEAEADSDSSAKSSPPHTNSFSAPPDFPLPSSNSSSSPSSSSSSSSPSSSGRSSFSSSSSPSRPSSPSSSPSPSFMESIFASFLSFLTTLSSFLLPLLHSVSQNPLFRYVRDSVNALLPRIWIVSNASVILFGIGYLVSFGSPLYYRVALLSSSIVFLSSLCMTIPFSISLDFLARVRFSSDFSFFFLAFVFSFGYHPLFSILGILFVPSLVHTVNYVVNNRLTENAYVLRLHFLLNQAAQSLLQICATFEFFTFLQLILDLLFGSGNLLLLLLYFNFLTDRIRSSPHSQLLISQLMQLFNQISLHPYCPSFVRQFYLKIEEWRNSYNHRM